MFVAKLLKNGILRVECLGGYIDVADAEGLDGTKDCKLVRFSGKDRNWYSEDVIGSIGKLYKLTEDNSSWRVKSILAKELLESFGFKI